MGLVLDFDVAEYSLSVADPENPFVGGPNNGTQMMTASTSSS